MKSTRSTSMLLAASALYSSMMLSSSSVVVSALSWKLDSEYATCGGDPFEDVILSATCTNQSACRGTKSTCTHKVKCGLGDTPDVTGRLTAVRAFSNNQVVVTPCSAGYCPRGDAKVNGRICNWITPINGQSCGELGDYVFSHSLQLPGEDSATKGMGWLMLKSLTIKIHVQNDASCQSTTKKAGYELPNPVMGLAVMAGVGFALCRDRRRRKRDGEEEDEEEEEAEEETYREGRSYVEMGSAASSSAASSRDTASRAVPPAVYMSSLPSVDLDRHPVPVPRHNGRHNYSPPPPAQRPHQNPSMRGSPAHVATAAPPHHTLPQASFSKMNDVSSTSMIHPPPNQQIPLEVLKQWYEHHGIAIV